MLAMIATFGPPMVLIRSATIWSITALGLLYLTYVCTFTVVVALADGVIASRRPIAVTSVRRVE